MQLKLRRTEQGASYTLEATLEFSLNERRTLSRYGLINYVVADRLSVGELELGTRRQFSSFSDLAQAERGLRDGCQHLKTYLTDSDPLGRDVVLDFEEHTPARAASTAFSDFRPYGMDPFNFIGLAILLMALLVAFLAMSVQWKPNGMFG